MGGRVVYAPAALVHHMVPVARLSRKFFLRRGYAQGISNILFQTETNSISHVFLWHLRQAVVGLRLLSRAVVSAVGYRLSRRDASGRFSRQVRMMYSLGYMVGAVQGAGRTIWGSRETPTQET